MRLSPPPEVVRELVAQAFDDFGVAAPDSLKETILIDDGRYVARSYRAGIPGHVVGQRGTGAVL